MTALAAVTCAHSRQVTKTKVLVFVKIIEVGDTGPRVIISPTITTPMGQKASIQVGDEGNAVDFEVEPQPGKKPTHLRLSVKLKLKRMKDGGSSDQSSLSVLEMRDGEPMLVSFSTSSFNEEKPKTTLVLVGALRK